MHQNNDRPPDAVNGSNFNFGGQNLFCDAKWHLPRIFPFLFSLSAYFSIIAIIVNVIFQFKRDIQTVIFMSIGFPTNK